MTPEVKRKQIDFEKLGYKTMLETGDELAAQKICGLHLHSFADEIQPEISHLSSILIQARARGTALCSSLYDRAEPVSDMAMLARTVLVTTLTVILAVVCLASVATNTVTFYLFGLSLALSLVVGLTLSGIAAACGHQLYDKFLVHQKAIEAGIICVAFLLCMWGLFQLNQARTIMASKASEASTNSSASSYVDDAPAADTTPTEPGGENQSDERKVRSLLGSAVYKIMAAADLMLGILLGIVLSIWHEENFVAWRALKTISRQMAEFERRRNELLAMVEAAKKRCMAGILRAKHTQRKKHVPYHQLPLLILLLMASICSASAQDISRHEGILLDVSGSIGVANGDLFQEYLASIKWLLASEPPKSRVWVSVISTDSFGGVRELVRGWTPAGQGVFTDDLNRARRQLASSFQAKAAGLRPVASGTDIIGGLWHLKALLDSGPASEHVSKDIWIFSDMMNETAQFNMPALIPTGPDGMLRHVKNNHLLVPLHGYRIHVVGASPAG